MVPNIRKKLPRECSLERMVVGQPFQNVTVLVKLSQTVNDLAIHPKVIGLNAFVFCLSEQTIISW